MMLLNCGFGEDSWEFLGMQGIKPVSTEGKQSWIFIERTDVEAATPILLAMWCKELTHWKRPWYWEWLNVPGEGDGRGWDGWMASPTQWIWVWVSSRTWGRTGKPGVLQSLGSQRVRHDWATELNSTLSEKMMYKQLLSSCLHSSR